MHSHTIETREGTRVYWMQWGTGAPLLFLNSAGMPTQMWDYQMTALAQQGYRCIGGRLELPPEACPATGNSYAAVEIGVRRASLCRRSTVLARKF